MGKGVLGNDPFLRGAAAQEGEDEAAEEQAPASPDPAKDSQGKKSKSVKRATAGKKAVAKPAAQKRPKPPPPSRHHVLSASAEASLEERIAPGVPVMARPAAAPVAPPPEPAPAVEQTAIPEEETPRVEAAPVEPAKPAAEEPPIPQSFPHSPGPTPQRTVYARDERPTDGGVIDAEFTPVEPEPLKPHDVRLAPVPFEPVPPQAKAPAGGVLALARDILAQALDTGTLKQAAGAATGLVHVVRTAIGAGSAQTLDDYGKDVELERAIDPLARFFFERYWRITVEGAHEVPLGRCILVANHSGALPFDGPVLAQALRRERADLEDPRWLVEDQIFYAPFLGTLLNRLGAIRASPENAVRLLEEERPVIVFPEGIQGMGKPYRERYQLKRFGRGGFAKLALRTRSPIIPVAIVGAEESMPLIARLPGKFLGFPYLPLTPLGPIPLPARWSIRFGDAIPMAEGGPGADANLAEVQRITERTREAIDGMIKARLRDRTSVFR